MQKEEIFDKLEANHEQFINYLDNLSQEDFEFAWADKWSAGQQLKHIVLSVRPLAQGFILPRFALKMVFGKANRPSKTFDQLVQRYNEKLQLGGRATGAFLPKPIHFDHKAQLFKTLIRYLNLIINNLRNYSEQDFDQMILPHPLLGKITVREMLYFTIHHVFHHQELVKQYLSKKA
ncbi:DinB family protein [Lacihabitans soyangensis]|uniref:DinB family protein n=1 Tax=Lacihabitans soyangensis TaxID=869394 RepID=A0AAE3KSP7_9BACT|nr:DinB family protein [Lacihabitans soyangensis]MCP9763582.1 DinB family protein [Lacihabitans soyangensis]